MKKSVCVQSFCVAGYVCGCGRRTVHVKLFAACNCEGRSGEEEDGKVSFYGKTAVIVKTNPDKMLLREH